MQLADTPFVEKEEAREVGLCRRVHLGLPMSEIPKYNLQTGRINKQPTWGKGRMKLEFLKYMYILALKHKKLTKEQSKCVVQNLLDSP